MPHITYNGKRVLSPGNKFIFGERSIIGPMDFAASSYVDLDGNPDLSGNKIIKWKMHLGSSAANHLFHLGVSENNMYVSVDGTTLKGGNFDNQSAGSSRSILNVTDLSGKTLECVASKTSNELVWFSCGHLYHDGNLQSSTGTPDQNTSRIGANGRPSPGYEIGFDVYVWDIEVIGEGAWNGWGKNSNTNAAWADSIGSNDGSIVGSPSVKSGISQNRSGYTYDDWFLPSRDEFQEMITELYDEGVGNFQGNIYWTSSETSATNAYAYGISLSQFLSVGKSQDTYLAKPIRSFTAGSGAYSLRDEGPGGGLVFYINGTTYYEAAQFDLMYGTGGDLGGTWSNIQNSASGATGTAIGTGSSNTSTIISQSGHHYGAAYICDQYGSD